MIADEFGLRWQRESDDQARHPETGVLSQMVRYRCVEHPHLTRVLQRPNGETAWAETYHRDDIPAQHWHDPRSAIAAVGAGGCS